VGVLVVEKVLLQIPQGHGKGAGGVEKYRESMPMNMHEDEILRSELFTSGS